MKKLIAVIAVAACVVVLLPASAAAQVYVKNGGKMGIGDFASTDPLQPLHIKQSGNPVFKFESTTTLADWNFKIDGNGNFSISRAGAPAGAELVVRDQTANPVVTVKGNIAATSFDVSSSRAVKEGFEAMSPADVLAKVTQLPISRWRYKDDPHATPHIGPMAEDFYAAFSSGHDDSHISLTDASGVALAAIQGLHQQASEKDQLIAELLSRIEKLEQRLADQ